MPFHTTNGTNGRLNHPGEIKVEVESEKVSRVTAAEYCTIYGLAARAQLVLKLLDVGA